MKKNYISPEIESMEIVSYGDILTASGTPEDNDTIISVTELFK